MTSPGPCQMAFAFADSPQGGKGEEPVDASTGAAFLLHTAKGNEAEGPGASRDEPDRLLEDVCSIRNLAIALHNVARNKGAPGADGVSVKEVVANSHRLLPALRRALLAGSYQPGDIRRVWIPKPGGGQRGLGIPNVVDRWVQQAVLQILEPIFEPHFHPSSHGFRPGRGAHTAIAEAKTHVAAGYDIVVDLDLSRFFDRVHHQRLLARLGERVRDRRILTLVRQMLKAQVVLPDGVRVSTDEGTPQGGPLSPLLSNVVLDELDWELERRGLRFVRYADDCNIFVRSERAGRRVMDATRRYIERKLRLVVNEEKSAVARPEERHFLGFRLRHAVDGKVEVHISARTKDRLDTRIRELTPRTWGQSLESLFETVNRYLRGWAGYFQLCTKEGADLFARYDAHIRRRVRAIIVKHKGRRLRFLFRHLVERGVSPATAARVVRVKRGTWPTSHSAALHRAYPNAWFGERLLSLLGEWQRLNPARTVSGQALLFDL